MKTLHDLNLKGKRVLYRVDINSPLKNGKLLDTTRLQSLVPTIKFFEKAGVKQVVMLAHQGREKAPSPDTMLDAHAKALSDLLKKPVIKEHSTRPKNIPSDAFLVLLENVRLDDEDHPLKEKREAFAKALAKLGDVYVNDAFAACHRDHASISSLPRFMAEKAAGLLLEKEIKYLSPLVHGEIEHPFVLIIGGAKMETKIGALRHFVKTVDRVLLGGGVANTFLAAEGYDIGESLYEPDELETAQDIAMALDKKGGRLSLPLDAVCADEIGSQVETIDAPVEDIMGDMKILDIGKKTIEKYVAIIEAAKTIVWNGPMGLFEYEPFQTGSAAIAVALKKRGATTILGGGETLAVVNRLSIPHKKFTHISTGGGAMLEYLSGKKLPGIEALE